MTALRTRWTAFLDGQHRYPQGVVGRFIGERMVRQHAPETVWTVDLLDLREDERVLEIGFGAGRGLALAAQQVHRGKIVGIDLSSTMMQAAVRRNQMPVRNGRIALVRGDVAALPFAEQQFDKIYSIHTFYFWPNRMQILADLVRVLRPRGVLVVTLATAQMTATGAWTYWPLHQELEALMLMLQQWNVARAELKHGPRSRQFNNVAILVQK